MSADTAAAMSEQKPASRNELMVVAAIVAAATLWVIALNQQGATQELLAEGGLASNGFGTHSPGLYNMFAALIVEVVFTAIFILVILGITDRRAPKGVAALAIGGALMLIHLVVLTQHANDAGVRCDQK